MHQTKFVALPRGVAASVALFIQRSMTKPGEMTWQCYLGTVFHPLSLSGSGLSVLLYLSRTRSSLVAMHPGSPGASVTASASEFFGHLPVLLMLRLMALTLSS